MRGWRQVLKNGELVPHTVGRDVEGGGEGRLLVLEHHRPHGFRVELHDDGGGLGVLVGRDGKGICDEEVRREIGEVAMSPAVLAASRMGRRISLKKAL